MRRRRRRAAEGGGTSGQRTRPSFVGGFALFRVGKCSAIDRAARLAPRWRRVVALALWAGAAWTVLSWTASLEHVVYGGVVSVLAAVAVSPLGPAARPWLLADVRRLGRVVALAAICLVRIVMANVGLARRVWSPSLPLRSGMLVFPTEMKSDGAVTAVALVSSVIVDNQIVDLEPGRVQYHAIWVASTEPDEAYEAINGPLERRLRPLDPGPTDG